MRRHKLFYGSAYDRGLEILLDYWPIIRDCFPDASLDVAYGWEWFQARYGHDRDRMRWMREMDARLNATGIIHHGRVGKDALRAIRRSCGIWAYPCQVYELYPITALEAQGDGCVPCVIECGALGEVVQSGVKVNGSARDPDVRGSYIRELLALMGDEERWEQERRKGEAYAALHRWEHVAHAWLDYFQDSDSSKRMFQTPGAGTQQ